MPLPAKVPRERRHILRNQFRASPAYLLAGVMEARIQLLAVLERKWGIGREATYVPHDQQRVCLGEEGRNCQGGIDHALQVLNGSRAIRLICARQIQQLTVLEQFRRMHD